MINLSKSKPSRFILTIILVYSIIIHTNWNLVFDIAEQLLY